MAMAPGPPALEALIDIVYFDFDIALALELSPVSKPGNYPFTVIASLTKKIPPYETGIFQNVPSSVVELFGVIVLNIWQV